MSDPSPGYLTLDASSAACLTKGDPDAPGLSPRDGAGLAYYRSPVTVYPGARQMLLPPDLYWPDANRPIAIVHHIAEGWLRTMEREDFWRSRGSSVHFAVGLNGDIIQLVPLTGAAWGNGWVREPSWPLLVSGTNPNRYTISIEHEGFTGDPWPEAQLAASAALTAWLLKTIAQPPDKLHVIGHREIDSITRANCPGSAWPQTDILEAADNGGQVLPAELRAAISAIATRRARELTRGAIQRHLERFHSDELRRALDYPSGPPFVDRHGQDLTAVYVAQLEQADASPLRDPTYALDSGG